jgi:hypothetical protein
MSNQAIDSGAANFSADELSFSDRDLKFVTEYARITEINCPDGVTLSDNEGVKDMISLYCFTITKMEGVRVHTSLRGTIHTPIIEFVVESELQEYHSDTGYHSDAVEVSRDKTLGEALKSISMVLLGWKLDAALESCCRAVEVADQDQV